MPKQPIVAVLLSSDAELRGRGIGFGAGIEDSNKFVSVDEFGVLVAGNVSYGGERLLDHVRDNPLCLAGSTVIGGHTVAEYTECPGGDIN